MQSSYSISYHALALAKFAKKEVVNSNEMLRKSFRE